MSYYGGKGRGRGGGGGGGGGGAAAAAVYVGNLSWAICHGRRRRLRLKQRKRVFSLPRYIAAQVSLNTKIPPFGCRIHGPPASQHDPSMWASCRGARLLPPILPAPQPAPSPPASHSHQATSRICYPRPPGLHTPKTQAVSSPPIDDPNAPSPSRSPPTSPTARQRNESGRTSIVRPAKAAPLKS